MKGIDLFDFANPRWEEENTATKMICVRGTEDDNDVVQPFVSAEVPFASNEEK